MDLKTKCVMQSFKKSRAYTAIPVVPFMKKNNWNKSFKTVLMTGILGVVSFSQTGCIGSFSLFNNVLEWNQGVGGKFVNAGLFFVLWVIPVYEVIIFIDSVVLNSIEFWTGSNPVAMKPGEKEVEYVRGKDGQHYKITASQNRFDIEQINGDQKKQAFVFVPESKTWSYQDANQKVDLLTLHADESISVYLPDGGEKHLSAAELSQMQKSDFRHSLLVESALAAE